MSSCKITSLSIVVVFSLFCRGGRARNVGKRRPTRNGPARPGRPRPRNLDREDADKKKIKRKTHARTQTKQFRVGKILGKFIHNSEKRAEKSNGRIRARSILFWRKTVIIHSPFHYAAAVECEWQMSARGGAGMTVLPFALPPLIPLELSTHSTPLIPSFPATHCGIVLYIFTMRMPEQERLSQGRGERGRPHAADQHYYSPPPPRLLPFQKGGKKEGYKDRVRKRASESQ